MPSQNNITNIPSSRVDFIDQRTGLMSREWYRFFLNLFNLTGAGNNPASLDDLQVGPPTGSGEGGNSGTVTSVNVSGGTTGLTTSGGPITSAGTITMAGTLNVANGGTGATTAGSARTNLGATTIGGNMFTLSDPSAVTFPRFNADNTISALDATSFRTAIGAGTGTGSVTSVAATGGTGISVTGSPITTSGTLNITNTAPDQTVVLNNGTGISVTGTYPNFTITNTSPSSGGTVTSVSTAGTVNGLTLTGGPITSSGTVTLGGTLDLSSPPAIGGTTPAAGTFTTLIAGGGSANYAQWTGGATTKAVEFKTLGSDANVAYAIRTKGTGAIDLAAGSSGVNISNGGTVTAITRTAQGSGYTTLPSVAITAPTTAGGVQATASPVMVAGGTSPTITSGGTGYTVNDVLTVVGGTPVSTAATITVTSVSGGVITGANWTNYGSYTTLPTNPVSVTGGTGTGATFTVSWGVNYFTITNAGSGYVEQPTVSFSGGGGSGAAAYATVGSIPTIKTIGSAVSFAVPSGEVFRVSDANPSAINYLQVEGTGGGSLLRTAGASTNPSLGFLNKGTGNFYFSTNNSVGNQQLNISHTASAVNYVQVTGAATTVAPSISAQGSDTNVNLNVLSKGSGYIGFTTNATSNQVRILHTANANYITLTGSASGSAVVFGAGGSDTNIDLAFTPKGTGVLKTTAVANIGAGTVLSGATNPLVAMTGNTNQYVQSYIVNNNAGTSASSDFAAYANNSTDSHGWADMGFTSSVYADATYTVTGPNEAYLFGSALNSSYTGNLVYATDSTGSANVHQFYVGGFTQAKSAWKAQIDSTGVKALQVNATNGLIVNSMTVSANYTVATGDNAMSVGPMTIASGVAVTVSSGSRWVVI